MLLIHDRGEVKTEDGFKDAILQILTKKGYPINNHKGPYRWGRKMQKKLG